MKSTNASITTYTRRLLRQCSAADKGKAYEADPPCGECTACCRAGYDIHFHPKHDVGREGIFNWTAGKGVLPQVNGGVCLYLMEGECTVYDTRPFTCRAYDCRVLAFASIVPDHEGMASAIKEWDLKGSIKTKDDVRMFNTIPKIIDSCIAQEFHLKKNSGITSLAANILLCSALSLGIIKF